MPDEQLKSVPHIKASAPLVRPIASVLPDPTTDLFEHPVSQGDLQAWR